MIRNRLLRLELQTQFPPGLLQWVDQHERLYCRLTRPPTCEEVQLISQRWAGVEHHQHGPRWYAIIPSDGTGKFSSVLSWLRFAMTSGGFYLAVSISSKLLGIVVAALIAPVLTAPVAAAIGTVAAFISSTVAGVIYVYVYAKGYRKSKTSLSPMLELNG